MKNQLSCTHFLCKEAHPPLICTVLAWALRLGVNKSSVPDSNPVLLSLLLLLPFFKNKNSVGIVCLVQQHASRG